MRKYHLTGLGFMFSIFGFFVSFASAASISGTVTYEGSQSGSIVVAAFNYSLTCSGPYAADPNPYNIVELETFGNYTIPDLPDGTYYLASVIFTDGLDGDLQATDPWAIYGCGDTPTPIVISGGIPATDKDMDLVDGTDDVPNPFYSTYYIIAHSAHDSGGYWMEIYVDDSSHNATAVSVTGPGISGGPADLEYNSSEGRWDSSNTGNLAFTESPLTPLPLTYDVAITDGSGTAYHEVVIQGYVEVFASSLSPGGGQVVTGNPVFSWTGVEGGYTYEIRLDTKNWYKNNLTETSIAYDGPPLVPGTNYEWHVNVVDQDNNVAYSFANFVYQPTQQLVSLADAINYLKILITQTDTIPPETTIIDANSDEKIGLEEAVYALQIVAGIRPQPYNALKYSSIFSQNSRSTLPGSSDSYVMFSQVITDSPYLSLYIQNNTFNVPISYSQTLDLLSPPYFTYMRRFPTPPFAPPGIAWEGMDYTFFVDNNSNSVQDSDEAFMTCTVPEGAFRQLDIPEVSIEGTTSPTISWQPVAGAVSYVLNFFEITPENTLGTLVFIIKIDADGSPSYSYTYNGDLFSTNPTLAVMVIAKDDDSSCYYNRSIYTTSHGT